MTTSGSSDFELSGNDIIRMAAQKIVAVRPGATMGPGIIPEWRKALNVMVKHWQADGVYVWTTTEATLFPDAETVQYALSTATASANATQTYVTTALSAAEASGQTVLSVDSVTGISSGDRIGIELDDGTRHWTTVNGAPTTGSVTITAALTDDAATGAAVYAYTSRIVRPLRIVAARSYDPVSGQETPLTPLARLDYMALPNKTQTGSVNQFFYDPQVGTGQLYLWLAPDAVGDLVKFTWHRPFQDFDAGADTPDMPPECLRALIWNLALEKAPDYEVPPEKIAGPFGIGTMALQFYNDLKGFGDETESTFFGVDME